MGFSRIQIGIAVGAGVLVLLIFFGYLMWLNGQGPVLSRSDDRDPLSGTPNSISLNPLRDRTTERLAAKYLDAMRDGHCQEQLGTWEKDYRKKYAAFICASEAQHPLLSWKVVDWEDAPPLRILHYRGKRRNAPGQPGTYKELVLGHAREQRWRVGSHKIRRHVLISSCSGETHVGPDAPSGRPSKARQDSCGLLRDRLQPIQPQSPTAATRRGLRVR